MTQSQFSFVDQHSHFGIFLREPSNGLVHFGNWPLNFSVKWFHPRTRRARLLCSSNQKFWYQSICWDRQFLRATL